MFIYSVVQAFEKKKVDYAIAGGFAVALHGAVRGTYDLDLVIRLSEKSFVDAERALLEIGLSPRLPIHARDVFTFREEYIRNRNLTAWSFVDPQNPSHLVDIIITENVKDMKTVKIKSGGHSLRVISIEDLMKMKNKSGRPQDKEDIRALRKLTK